jgi:8-amino-7-oxononanoate synthase
VGFSDYIQAQLADLRAADLLRAPHTVSGAQGPEFVLDGRRTICLCSNNYLGLAADPSLSEAIEAAVSRFGFGACASRHVTGTMTLHVEAERRIARFMNQPRALLFATGYGANTGTVQALSSRETLVLSDSLNHASLIDGCRLGGGEVRVYGHCDPSAVEALLQRHAAEHPATLVVTESLFSMDGDIAPLRELRELCDHYGAALLVDEAHALGVRGQQGQGLCAEQNVRADLITGTFGKAFGASGAFVAGSDLAIQLIENRARPYVFSTAPSPTLAAAVLAAIDLVEQADAARARLHEHARVLRDGLASLGYRIPAGDSHIIPVFLGSARAATDLSARLLERGVFVHGIRPPTVAPETSRLRVVPMATHETDQLAFALKAFQELRA